MRSNYLSSALRPVCRRLATIKKSPFVGGFSLSFRRSGKGDFNEFFCLLFCEWGVAFVCAKKRGEVGVLERLCHDVCVLGFFHSWIDKWCGRLEFFSVVLKMWFVPFPEVISPVDAVLLGDVCYGSPFAFVCWVEFGAFEPYIDRESVLVVAVFYLREACGDEFILSLFASPGFREEYDFSSFVDLFKEFLDLLSEFWGELVGFTICGCFHKKRGLFFEFLVFLRLWELYFDGVVDSLFDKISECLEEEAYHVKLWEEFSGSYGVCVLQDAVSFRGDKYRENPLDVSCLGDLESFEYQSEAEDYYDGDELLDGSKPGEVTLYLAFVDFVLFGDSCDKVYYHEGREDSHLFEWDIEVFKGGYEAEIPAEFRRCDCCGRLRPCVCHIPVFYLRYKTSVSTPVPMRRLLVDVVVIVPSLLR
jgi:hypothetical protein